MCLTASDRIKGLHLFAIMPQWCVHGRSLSIRSQASSEALYDEPGNIPRNSDGPTISSRMTRRRFVSEVRAARWETIKFREWYRNAQHQDYGRIRSWFVIHWFGRKWIVVLVEGKTYWVISVPFNALPYLRRPSVRFCPRFPGLELNW